MARAAGKSQHLEVHIMARSIIPWFGGKHRLAPKIIQLIPQDHTIYCEPFGGAASVLLNKPRSKVEVYNDLNEGLYSLFTVLSDEQRFATFYGQLVLKRWSRQEFERNLERWKVSTDIVERAIAFYVLAKQSFGGNAQTWGYERNGKRCARFMSSLDKLPEIHERTNGIFVEHNDWRKVLEAFDTPETVFYLDPPYAPETRKDKAVYTHEMGRPDHEEMVKRLVAAQGRGLLSGYKTAIYKPLENAGWTRLEWNYTMSACGTVRGANVSLEEKQRVECLWVHPGIPLPDELIQTVGARVGVPQSKEK